MKNKTLISLVFLIIIIMFSFPWIMISCGGQPIMRATGFQIATGSYGSYEGEGMPKSSANFWLILVLILSGVGVIIGLTMKEEIAHKTSAWLSSIVSVILIIFRVVMPIMARSSAGSDEFDAGMSQIIQVSFEPAFYITLLLSIGCAFLNFYVIGGLKERKLPINNVSPGDSEPKSYISDDFIFCPECGTKNPKSNKFCSKCGVKLPEGR